MPIIIDITEAGALVPHWQPYRKDEDVQRVYEEVLLAGSLFGRPNFQRREIQYLWNLEVKEVRLLLLWKLRPEKTWQVESGKDLDAWNADFACDYDKYTFKAKEFLMVEAYHARRARVKIEEALADKHARTAPARLTKRSKYAAKLEAIKVKDDANRKANSKLSREARAQKLVESGDARSITTAKKWLRDLDSRQH
jgi:hypothetical protein